MDRTERLTYPDMAKGIGIILVLFGHLAYTGEYVRVWISSFHMPLFFVIAGITMSLGKSDVGDTKTRIYKRYRGLVIPYLWFSVLYFFIDIGNLYIHKIDMHTFIVNAISSVTFYGKSVMWFMTALFLSQVALILLQKKIYDTYVFLGAIIIAVISYFCSLRLAVLYNMYIDSLLITSLINVLKTFARAGIVLPFVALGYYGKKVLDKAGFFDGPFYIRLSLGIGLLIINIYIAIANWSVDTNNMVLGNPVLYYLGSITGSLAIIFICSSIRINTDRFSVFTPLIYVGKNSLVIMAIHLDLYVLWAGLQAGKLVYRYVRWMPALTITTVIITLILGSIAAYVINRFFPFVLGKPFDKNRAEIFRRRSGKRIG